MTAKQANESINYLPPKKKLVLVKDNKLIFEKEYISFVVPTLLSSTYTIHGKVKKQM